MTTLLITGGAGFIGSNLVRMVAATGQYRLVILDALTYAGNLQNWSPMLTAAAPGLIYSILSLGAFAWLVIRR